MTDDSHFFNSELQPAANAHLPLASFRLKNFKAVRDSGLIEFSPLTVLIGNNGSGKSSLIEGLQTYQRIVTDGLDKAMQLWRGFEHIRHAAAAPRNTAGKLIEFEVHSFAKVHQCHTVRVNASADADEVFIFEETLSIDDKNYLSRNKAGEIFDADGKWTGGNLIFPLTLIPLAPLTLNSDQALLTTLRYDSAAYQSAYIAIENWQFLRFNADSMGEPRRQQRARRHIRLATNGLNIAEYLLDILRRDPDAFAGILETLQYALPYAKDLQPTLVSELERAVYLQMSEQDYQIPGWLLSTGTLRLLALLALFRHPQPPPLILIEEIENGLDPRMIHLLVEELRSLVESGRTQVIATTHSPYLLDLLALPQIVLVERQQGQPEFSRPADEASLRDWARDFGPGALYTMDKLGRG